MWYDTFKTDLVDTLPLDVGHVPEDGEDDEAGQEAGEAVDGTGEDGVAVAVVVELVVGR